MRKPKKTLAEIYAGYFPIKRNVTKTILKKAVIVDPKNCIGALTLKAALGEKLKLTDLLSESIWGDRYGTFEFTDGSTLNITTEGRMGMMDIKTPTTVTFIVN